MRNRTIDIFRGISISVMLFIHIQRNWLILDEWWFVGLSYLVALPFEVNGFLFVVGMSFGYSWKKDQIELISRKDRYLKSLSRTFILFAFSMAYNVIAVFLHDYGWSNLWFWYILQSIWVSRLLGLIVADWSPKLKKLILIIGLGTDYFIWNGLEQIRVNSWIFDSIYYILFNPIGQDSIVFYFGFFLLGTLIGEEFYQFSDKSPEFIKPKIRKWIIGGIILMILGILIGWPLSSQEIGWHLIEFLNTSPNIKISTLPLIFIIQSPAWAYFTAGAEIIIVIFLFWIIDVHNPSRSSTKNHLLEIFGKYSLSIYFLHYLLFILPIQVELGLLLIIEIFTFGVIYLIVIGINKYTHSRLSFEYLVDKLAKTLFQLLRFKQSSD
jgi:hypothetical protein